MTADEVVKLIANLLDSQQAPITLEEQVNAILARSNRLDAWRAYQATASPLDPIVTTVLAAYANATKPL